MRTKGPLLHLCFLALFTAIAVSTLWLALPGLQAEDVWRNLRHALGELPEEIAATWQAALTTLVAGSGAAALLGLWLRGKLVALPANPAKLVAALTRRASLGDFSDKLAFRHRFGRQFEEVCRALTTRTSPGLVILIDDLDRCQPADVLKVLEAVNYLVSAGPCTIVLGMDRRQVEHAVGLGFKELVAGLPEDELLYADSETPDEAGKQRAYARHYPEKLINIEVPVPPLEEAALEGMLLGQQAGTADEEPRWLQRLKRVCGGAYQIAKVAVFAMALGLVLTAGLERLSAPTSLQTGELPTVAGPDTASPSAPAAASPAPIPSAAPDANAFEFATVPVELMPPSEKVARSSRWLWWGPTVLVLALALLFGVAAVIHRERQVVRDSPAFEKALRAVKPLFAATNATPRVVKRYQNRMRYLAARLRPPTREPDRIDSLLHWLGRKLGRAFVPDSWFADPPPQAIAEPALILLGAAELFAPHALARPAEFLAVLDAETIPARAQAWAEVRAAFAAEPLSLPEPHEIARYKSFVQAPGRPSPSPRADILPFPRDPTQGSRSA